LTSITVRSSSLGGGIFYLTIYSNNGAGAGPVTQQQLFGENMKKHFTVIFLSAVVFALILPGCGNKEPEIPVGPQGPAPGTIPGGSVAPGSHYEGGYLAGPGASYTFTVNAGNVTYLEVPFTYPAGSVDFGLRW
jgi:hypothetical protein